MHSTVMNLKVQILWCMFPYAMNMLHKAACAQDVQHIHETQGIQMSHINLCAKGQPHLTIN